MLLAMKLRAQPGSFGLREVRGFGAGAHSGSDKGVFWKRGLFRKVHFLEVLENLEILEILENPQTVEKIKENPTIF